MPSIAATLSGRVTRKTDGAAIAGAIAYLALQTAGMHRLHAALAGIAVAVVLRLAAILWRLRLPVIPVPGEEEKIE